MISPMPGLSTVVWNQKTDKLQHYLRQLKTNYGHLATRLRYLEEDRHLATRLRYLEEHSHLATRFMSLENH